VEAADAKTVASGITNNKTLAQTQKYIAATQDSLTTVEAQHAEDLQERAIAAVETTALNSLASL